MYEGLQEQINNLKKELECLKKEYESTKIITRFHLIRVKNGEKLSDDYILRGRHYNDFSPSQAYEFYNQVNENFILLDVSDNKYSPPGEIPEAIKIPLEELPVRFKEIVNKAIPILIISEQGLKSILACEMLNQFGYYNVNNISGGYKFWPAFREKHSTHLAYSQEKKSA